LLASFSKVSEKLINSRLFTHIYKNDILLDEQYGFRPNISTEIASFKLINEIEMSMGGGGIFCDLEKAFDFTNHRILLDKLEFYGIVGKFHLLIKSFSMRVFKEYLLIQELLTVRSNTPTGKRLKVGFHKAPLLFLLYINDLPKMATKDANIALFADDKSIIVTSSNDTNLKVLMNEIFTDINK
jgi:hypothetical protein